MKYFKYIIHWLQVKFLPNTLVPHQRFSLVDTRKVVTESIKQSKNYLEYGGGWSTKIASTYGVNFLSIESDKTFCKYLSKKYVNNPNQYVKYIDIGITTRWGYPLHFSTREGDVKKYYEYVSFPFKNSNERLHFDTILIDGRFRISCFLQVLIDFAKYNKNSKVIFDDFFVDSRESYQFLLDYINEFDKHGSVCIIEINQNNVKKIPDFSDIEKYLEDPS